MQFPVKLTEEQMKTAFLEEAGSNGDIYVYKMLTCSICMESITAVKGVNVNCGHAFHAECIVPWLQRDRRRQCIVPAEAEDPVKVFDYIPIEAVPSRISS